MSDSIVKPKKPFYKKWWFWVLAVIVIIVAANSGNKSQPKSAAGQADTSKSAAASATPEKTEFAVGEAVKLKDNILTVTKVEKSAGAEFEKPKDGMEFVIVTVQIENGGKDVINYNPMFEFKVQNSQGQISDTTFSTVNSNSALNSGQLAPSGKVSGTMVFEQPKADPKLQLQYKPSFWSNKTVKVNLQ